MLIFLPLKNLPDFYFCKCFTAIDPCNRDNGGCSHRCENVAGRSVCSCPPGHRLARDGKTCTGKNNF